MFTLTCCCHGLFSESKFALEICPRRWAEKSSEGTGFCLVAFQPPERAQQVLPGHQAQQVLTGQKTKQVLKFV